MKKLLRKLIFDLFLVVLVGCSPKYIQNKQYDKSVEIKNNYYEGTIKRENTSYQILITFVETKDNEFMSMKVTFNEKVYILNPSLEDIRII